MSTNGTSDGELYNVDDLTIEDFFDYSPSLALAWTALALYATAAALVALIIELNRRWRFMYLISITGLCEAGGYAALVYSIIKSGQTSVFSSYVAMQVLIILSPNLIQATQYWELGIILRYCPEVVHGRKMLRGWVITTCFVCADLVALIVQAIGISIWATSQSSGNPDQGQIRLGCIITLVGLGFQLTFQFCFTCLAIWVNKHRGNTLRQRRQLWAGLFLCISFLFIRNIFRFVEFTQNTILTWPPPDTAYVISQQQVLFYTLDTLPVLLVFASYIILHPSRLLPKPGDADAVPREQPASDDWVDGLPVGAIVSPVSAATHDGNVKGDYV